MSKVLITGAQGFLGVRLTSYLCDRYEVLACSHSDLDITDRAAVLAFFHDHRPDFVVHCAAISDTGYSQQHPETSLQVNVIGTENIAMACAVHAARLVYMSSDQVYNGTDQLGGLPETAPLQPKSVYGQHKLEAEQRVAAVLPSAVGLRLTWMYDRLDSPYKLNRNILFNLQQAFDARQHLSVASREYRGITWVWEVVRRIESCFHLPGGVYNFGAENVRNSYDTFVAVARLMQLDAPETWIDEDAARFPEHPRNLSIDIQQLRLHHLDFPSTVEGVAIALQHQN